MSTRKEPVTPLQRWLSEKSDDERAAEFGVSKFTVRDWRLGIRPPLPKHAQVIAKVAGMSLDDVYAAQ